MDEDCARYIGLLKKYKARFRVRLYAYCLMPTTVALIVHPENARQLSAFMQCMNQSYAMYFNRKYNGVGSVWGQRFKSTVIADDHDLLATVKSLEFIPVREERCASPFEYPWSSCAKRILGAGGVIDPVPVREVNVAELLIHNN